MADLLIKGLSVDSIKNYDGKVTVDIFEDGVWCDVNNNENHGKAIPVHNGDRKPGETGTVGHEKLLEILCGIYPEELAAELFEKLKS